MRFKRIASLFTAAAVTASCAAGMLMFDASAEYTARNVTVVTESGIVLSLAEYLNSVSGRSASFLSQKIKFDQDARTFAARLTRSDLIAMRNDRVCTRYEFILTDESGFRYTATINQSDIPYDSSLIPENGITLALSFVSGKYESKTEKGTGTVKCLDAKGASAFGGVTVNYSITAGDFSSLLSAYGIISTSDINCLAPYSDSDGKICFSLDKKIQAFSDAEFSLTGSTTNYRRFAYDPDSKYYSSSGIRKTASEILGGIIGYSETEIKEKSAILDPAASAVADTLTGTYYSRDEIEKAVRKYLSGAENLKSLIDSILNDEIYKKAIYEAVYSVFGESISSYQADKIAAFIRPDLVEKLFLEIVSSNSYITDTYNGRIGFFLNQYATGILTDLKQQVAQVQKQMNLGDGNIAQILEMLDVGRYTSGQTVSEYESTAVRGETAFEKAVANGYEGNITDWLNNTAATAYQLAVSYGYRGTSDQWFNALTALDANSAYAQAAGYGYSGTMSDFIASLGGSSANSYRSTTTNEQTQTASQSTAVADGSRYFEEWIISRFGSTDGFMAAIANIVINSMESGESAYQIAVRNGFTGTEQQWLDSLKGESAYEIAVRNGFVGTEQQWLASLKGKDGKDGTDGKDGEDAGESRVIYMQGYGYNSAAIPGGEEPKDTDDSAAVMQSDALTTGSGLPESADKTGIPAAAILVPAAGVASLLLLKKDNRKSKRRRR